MSQYSIKDLEKLSGIKAHTIRIWEKRYGVLTPDRTNTNIRYYSDEQLKKLLNVSILIGFGYKISRVSQWSADELHAQIQDAFQAGDKLEDQAVANKINGLIVAMIELDEEKFKSIYEVSIGKRGFEDTMLKVVYPFLERVGIMWGINEINPAEEHFISNLIRQKVVVEIDNLEETEAEFQKQFILFLPENELHEMGLLLANYLVRMHGHKAFYLGQNVPVSDVLSVCKTVSPEYIITFTVTTLQEEGIQRLLDTLRKETDAEILISGRKELFEKVNFPKGSRYLESMDALNQMLHN